MQEHARDSFENLLFSLCRFHALTGRYPERLVIVSYEFKHERFASIHAKAVRWPTTKLDFLGTPALSSAALQVSPYIALGSSYKHTSGLTTPLRTVSRDGAHMVWVACAGRGKDCSRLQA